jgi:two-component system sensor kinase FixL
MCAAITHELNQPLTAIINYIKAAQRLLGSQDLQPNQIAGARDALEKAAGQTVRAGTIIRHLRELADQREISKTPEDINDVIQESVALIFAEPSRINFVLDLDKSLPQIPINRIQMRQVLTNLIRNILEAANTDSVRQLTISSGSSGPDSVRLLLWDSETGLTSDVLATQFQPSIAAEGRGIGIGLKICQSLVEAHAGTIRTLPDIYSGVAFEIQLPIAVADDELD